MTTAIRNDSTVEFASTRRRCRPQRVATVAIVNFGKLEMWSLLRSSSDGRKEWQRSPCHIVEYRRKPPILVPAVRPFVDPSINFFALAGHHGSPRCVEVRWCKLPMCWRRAEDLNELPETALASVMNNR